jgi:hypothetical protein
MVTDVSGVLAAVIVLVVEAARISGKSKHFVDYTALQPRRQPSSRKKFETTCSLLSVFGTDV